MQLVVLKCWLVVVICMVCTYAFLTNSIFRSSMRFNRPISYRLIHSRPNSVISEVIDTEIPRKGMENTTGHFTKRYLCATVCPQNKVMKHVELWDNHMKWLKVAARYKPTRRAVVVGEHLMLSDDRTRPHAHLIFVDSNDAIDVLLYGMVNEPFVAKGGSRDWQVYEVDTIVPWKSPEIVDSIFEYQVFVGRIRNNRTTEASDRMLKMSSEYYAMNPDQILYAARLYPAWYGESWTPELAAAWNMHRPIGEVVMLRTNNRSEAITFLKGNPMLEGFTGHTNQFDPEAQNALNMTYWLGSTRTVPFPVDIPYADRRKLGESSTPLPAESLNETSTNEVV